MKATILYGNQRYTDDDLYFYRRKFLMDWGEYKKNTLPSLDSFYAKPVIASYNEYYYRRKIMEREVYKKNKPDSIKTARERTEKNNRSFMTKLVDKTFGMLYDDSAVKYSCYFKEELPHREEVLNLIRKYGKWVNDNHEFVIEI